MPGQAYNTEDNYTGLSTVDKPTQGIVPGAVFTESDTTRVYVWSGDAWVTTSVIDPIALAQLRLSRLILNELRRLN